MRTHDGQGLGGGLCQRPVKRPCHQRGGHLPRQARPVRQARPARPARVWARAPHRTQSATRGAAFAATAWTRRGSSLAGGRGGVAGNPRAARRHADTLANKALRTAVARLAPPLAGVAAGAERGTCREAPRRAKAVGSPQEVVVRARHAAQRSCRSAGKRPATGRVSPAARRLGAGVPLRGPGRGPRRGAALRRRPALAPPTHTQ